MPQIIRFHLLLIHGQLVDGLLLILRLVLALVPKNAHAGDPLAAIKLRQTKGLAQADVATQEVRAGVGHASDGSGAATSSHAAP